jgi:hypothetical protein
MLPKLPEPNELYITLDGEEAEAYTEASVRSIQEEAYRAGMAAVVPDYPTVYKWAQDSGFIVDGQLDDFINYIVEKLSVSPGSNERAD